MAMFFIIQTIYKVKNMNKKILNATKLLSIATLLVTSVGVTADTQSITASVDVLNAVALTNESDISFGTLQVTTDDTDVATYTLSADPAATSGTIVATGAASIQELTYGNSGEFSIAGVVAFTDLTLTLPDVATTPLTVTTPGTSNDFEITELTAYDILNSTDITLTNGAGTITADSTGALSFGIGATLSTIADATAYIDGTYTVDFNVTVEY